ncbi:MAG: histidinol-phosphatase HisJ family protein [Clostridiales bacterium]|nr:histidinol-phosphatase HisJ family protein [Clostridiales bacterium]
MFSDTHNHTLEFSPDAKMTYEELVSAASSAGLRRVAITEHYEIDNPDPNDNIQTYDLDEYFKVFPSWRVKALESGIELLAGIEFGYQTSTAGKIDATASSYPFDEIILSNHLFRGIDVYYSKDVYQIDRITRHKEYIGKVAEMAERVRDFDIAGHFDYINRYNPSNTEDILYSDCPSEFDRLFEALIADERALEINTRIVDSRIKKCLHSAFPDPEIIKRYASMGGKLITLGSDSHTTETSGIHFREVCEYLRALGFGEVAYFRERRIFTDPVY